MSKIKNKVDFVITDSPLPLGAMYLNKLSPPHLKDIILEDFNSYNNLNFYIERTKTYNSVGRNQTEGESNRIANEIKTFLSDNNINFITTEGNKSGYKYIVDYITETYPLK